MTEEEFHAALEAEATGRATELTHCPFDPCNDALRGVLDKWVTRGFDPTEVLVLSCGHEVF